MGSPRPAHRGARTALAVLVLAVVTAAVGCRSASTATSVSPEPAASVNAAAPSSPWSSASTTQHAVPTTQPPAKRTTFRAGDSFSDDCTIAWPTAPQYDSTGIEMRTTCAHLGMATYQFVDIRYEGDLEPTPSHATVRVRGTVVNVVRSGAGFSVLQVLADSAQVL